MSCAVIDVKNPIELREAGLRALRDTLGADAARAFLDQYFEGEGDFTAEKYKRPELPFEEVKARIWEAGNEIKARRAG